MRGDKFVEILKTKVKILEVTRQADDQITVLVDRNDLPLAVKTLYYDIGGFISTMIPNDERQINGCYALYYAISMEGSMVKIAPITTIMFGAAVCSLVGVPAFAIFVSEYNVFVGAITSGQYIAVALFAIALAVIFIADFAHFNMASFGEPKGVVVHNKEMSLFENLPLIALCALIIIFGVWHVDSFYTLVNNGVNIMMGALK